MVDRFASQAKQVAPNVHAAADRRQDADFAHRRGSHRIVGVLPSTPSPIAAASAKQRILPSRWLPASRRPSAVPASTVTGFRLRRARGPREQQQRTLFIAPPARRLVASRCIQFGHQAVGQRRYCTGCSVRFRTLPPSAAGNCCTRSRRKDARPAKRVEHRLSGGQRRLVISARNP